MGTDPYAPPAVHEAGIATGMVAKPEWAGRDGRCSSIILFTRTLAGLDLQLGRKPGARWNLAAPACQGHDEAGAARFQRA